MSSAVVKLPPCNGLLESGCRKHLHKLRVPGILSVSLGLAPGQRSEVRRARRFFQVSAISADNRIAEVCSSEAFHPLRPYGSSPQIVMTTIQKQEACFIFPSADQPVEMNKQAALIVRYPRPVQIGGMFYNYFILWADVNHIRQIGGRLSFH